MMYKRGLERLKEQEGNVPHTVKSKNEFQGPSSNKTRVRTFRDNPKAIKHAQRIKMLQTFICPPLVVGSEGDLFSVRSLLNVVAKDKFMLELSETGEIRIYPSDSFAYFDIANTLLENDLPLRGLKQAGQNEFKAICIGLHQDEDMNAIQEALGALGHDVLQISRTPVVNEFPPLLATYTVTLERAENNWEIFNVTKLLGMKVTFRPPPRVLPPPKCLNCLQVGHFEYECGRHLCDSCECSFIKGRKVIAKLAFEWPLTVKTRPKGPEEPKKKVRKGIIRSSDINSEQQPVSNESQETSNKAQEAVHGSQVENVDSQEANGKVEDICRIDRTSVVVNEWLEKINQTEEESEKKYRKLVHFKIRKKEMKSKRETGRPPSSDENNEDDEDDDKNDKFNLMGYSSSDSSSSSPSITTTYTSSTTGDSAVFDDSSIPSDREPDTREPEVFKTILKEWYLDVEEQPSYSSSSSSSDLLNSLEIPTKKDKEEDKSKRPLIQEQKMLTLSFVHTRHSKSHKKAMKNTDTLGRSPIIKKKEAHRYTTSIGCGTHTRVKIVKERPQNSERKEEEKDEEQYEENEVHTLLMSAKYSLDTEASHSRQESRRKLPVRNYDRDNERDDEGDDEEDDERNNERLHYGNRGRRPNTYPRDIQRKLERRLRLEGNEEHIYEEPERGVDRNPQREPDRVEYEEPLLEEDERYFRELSEEELLRYRYIEREFERADRSFNSFINGSQTPRPLNDPRTMAQRYAAVAPTSFNSPFMFCPTLYNRRYPYTYEEFLDRYMNINNNEEIPEETAMAWLELIYHEIESLLNYVDRIGNIESYRIIMEKVRERFRDKFQIEI